MHAVLSGLLIFGLPFVSLLALGLFANWYEDRDYGYSERRVVLQFFAWLGLGCATIWLVLVAPLYYGGRTVDKSNCHHDGQQMERQTKFRQYNAFTWKCLVQTRHGYVDIAKLNGFDNAG